MGIAASGWKVVPVNFFNKKTNNRHRIASTNGLNPSNLAGKFKTDSLVMETSGIKKAQKNAVITCKAAKGWKITSLGFSNEKTNVARSIYNDNPAVCTGFSKP